MTIDEEFNWDYNKMKINVSAEMIQDLDAFRSVQDHLNSVMRRSFDRMLNPWKYPDRVVGWKIELFPKSTALRTKTKRFITRKREKYASKVARLADRIRGYSIEGDYDY